MEQSDQSEQLTSDGARSELFVVSLVGTLLTGAVLLTLLSWKHLRSKAVPPADAPILVQ